MLAESNVPAGGVPVPVKVQAASSPSGHRSVLCRGLVPGKVRGHDGIPGRKPVAGATDHHIVAEAPGLEVTGQVGQIALHLEARGQGVLEGVFEICLVESRLARYPAWLPLALVLVSTLTGSLILRLAIWLQHPDIQLPVGAEILLHPHFADLIIHIHARKALPITSDGSDRAHSAPAGWCRATSPRE